MNKKEYHKIETLFKFDQKTKKFDNRTFYNQDVNILANNLWIFTEKIDGTNLRIIWDGHKLTYAGRTNNAVFSEEQKTFIEGNLVNEYFETIFEQTFQEKVVYVYGELFGAKIQNGGLYVGGKGMAFMVFDVEIGEIFLTMESAKALANELGYNFVPFVLIGTIYQGIDYVKQNEISTFSKANLEGLVGKPIGDFRDRLGKRIVVKIKRRDL